MHLSIGPEAEASGTVSADCLATLAAMRRCSGATIQAEYPFLPPRLLFTDAPRGRSLGRNSKIEAALLGSLQKARS